MVLLVVAEGLPRVVFGESSASTTDAGLLLRLRDEVRGRAGGDGLADSHMMPLDLQNVPIVCSQSNFQRKFETCLQGGPEVITHAVLRFRQTSQGRALRLPLCRPIPNSLRTLNFDPVLVGELMVRDLGRNCRQPSCLVG